MGTFAQRGLAASSLGHCGTPVPITCDAAIPTPSFHIGRGTRGTTGTLLPKSLGTSLAWLLACLRVARCCLGPPVTRSSIARVPHGLRLHGKDRHHTKMKGSRGYVSDSGLHAWPAPAWKGSAPHQNERFSGLRVRFRATPLSGRNTARTAVGGEFPTRTLSVMRRDPSSTIAHVSASPPLIPDGRISRVRLAAAAFPRRTFPCIRRFKYPPTYAPWMHSYTSRLGTQWDFHHYLALCPDGVSYLVPATYREPLCLSKVLPPPGQCPAPPRPALPDRHRSYWLMCPTIILLLI